MTATHPYAAVLGERDPLDALTETQQSIPALANSLGAEGLKRSYAPGKWTAAQVLAHLADCAIAFGFRVRQIISEPEVGIQPFDQDRWARQMTPASNGVGGGPNVSGGSRLEFGVLPQAQRGGVEQDGASPRTRSGKKADTVIRIMAGHTLHHLAQLETIGGAGQ